MAKCPVCKTEYATTDEYCAECGFKDIRREFINQSELIHWMEETVVPCQTIYRTMVKRITELRGKNEKLESEIQKASSVDNASNIGSERPFVANEVLYEDERLTVRFVEFSRKSGLFGFVDRAATFDFENKSTQKLQVYMKDISVGGVVNRSRTYPSINLSGKQKCMKEMRFIEGIKVPGSFDEFASVEFKVCYDIL